MQIGENLLTVDGGDKLNIVGQMVDGETSIIKPGNTNVLFYNETN